jgi:hypothetical protein
MAQVVLAFDLCEGIEQGALLMRTLPAIRSGETRDAPKHLIAIKKSGSTMMLRDF